MVLTRSLVVSAALTALLVLASTASADYGLKYCEGIWTPPSSRCSDSGPRHTYNSNTAQGFTYLKGADANWYDAKCERITAWDDYRTIFSRRCNSARQTVGWWDDFCGGCGSLENTGHLLKVYVGNDDPWYDQKMYGSARYWAIMMKTHDARRRVVALTLGTSVATLAAVGVAMTNERDSSEPPMRSTATQVDSRLKAGLAPFRRAQRAEDRLPQRARYSLEMATTLGANPEFSRRVRTGPSGEHYFLVAGEGSVALINEAGAGSIDDIDHALSGQAVGIEDCAMGGRGVKVVGLLPDAAGNAVLHVSDGSVIDLKVINNVYVVELAKTRSSLPRLVQWTQDGDVHVAKVPVPADILEGRCFRLPR
jgi:hypothetical protein